MAHVNILQSTGQENNNNNNHNNNNNNTKVRDLAFYLMFHRFSPVNCCLNVVS